MSIININHFIKGTNKIGVPVWKPKDPSLAEGREETHQTQLMTWIRALSLTYPELRLSYHIPNEGKRNAITGGKLKSQGLRAGVADLCIPIPSPPYAGLYIELKTGKNTASREQNEFLTGVIAKGYYGAICYGAHCAFALVEYYIERTKENHDREVAQ